MENPSYSLAFIRSLHGYVGGSGYEQIRKKELLVVIEIAHQSQSEENQSLFL